jgi:hypothetical protein
MRPQPFTGAPQRASRAWPRPSFGWAIFIEPGAASVRITRSLPPGTKRRPSRGTPRPQDGSMGCMRPEQGESTVPRPVRTGQNCPDRAAYFRCFSTRQIRCYSFVTAASTSQKFVDPRHNGPLPKLLKLNCILRLHQGRFVAETRNSLYLGVRSEVGIGAQRRAGRPYLCVLPHHDCGHRPRLLLVNRTAC